MDDAGRIDFLIGEVQALLAFAAALVKTHHDPELFARHFQAAEQAGLAKLETILALDELVEGFQFASEQILVALKSARAGDKPEPHTL